MAAEVGAGEGFEGESPSGDFEQLLVAAHRDGGPGNRRSTGIEWALWVLAALPGLALALVVSMAVRVRLADGSWPRQDQPDPKDLGLHNTLTTLLIVASFAAVVLVPLGSLAAFAAGRRHLSSGPLVIALALFAVLFGVLWSDVGGLGDWIAD